MYWRCFKYIGDADSKTFKNLLVKNPYGEDVNIERIECILHVGKRMYRQLTTINKTVAKIKKLRREETKKLEEAKKL